MDRPAKDFPAAPPPAGGAVAPARFASRPELTRGRLVAEAEGESRSVFQRDRDRIIHSGAFRRLQFKTQVFVYHVGDYYRTRLTHSIEVGQIARSISRALGLNEDLAEAVALAHDLGHTPFGHAGEDALAACMAPFGGFAHNEQTLRLLTRLETRYAEFDGLNLTWESLEGIVKHNGPVLPLPAGRVLGGTLQEIQAHWDLELAGYASLEAQVAAVADDIAYNNHDIDDGIRAGLFTIDDLADLPLVGRLVRDLRARYPALERRRLIHETVRRLVDLMVGDLLAETRRRLADIDPASADEVRAAGRQLVGFSAEIQAGLDVLRGFLFTRMYRHYRVNRETSKARRVVRDLFQVFLAEPNTLPEEWSGPAMNAAEPERARIVADYIAGMTDRYALIEHQRLFDILPRL